jgi:hypothetical protein
VSHIAVVVALSLCSALAFAVSTTLKKASASEIPHAADQGLAELGRFGRATVAHPLWLGGILADIVGVALQIAALHLGALAVVQPLMVSGLLFAMLMRPRGGMRVNRKEMAWASLLVCSLVALLSVSGSLSGPLASATATAGEQLPEIAFALVGASAAAICLSTLCRRIPSLVRTALIGVALGAVYAGTATLVKAATDLWAARGAIAVITSWELYAVAVFAAIGLVIAQIAFRAGPLAASLPATSTSDPLLSILLGVVVYDEHLRAGPLDGVVLLGLVALLGISIVMIVRNGDAAESRVPAPQLDPGDRDSADGP